MIVKRRNYLMVSIILFCSFLVSCSNNPAETTKTSPEISETEQTVPIETRIIPEPETEESETKEPENDKLEAEVSLSEGTNGHLVSVSLVNKTNKNYMVRCTINIFDKDNSIIASKPYDTLIESLTKIDEIIIFDELDEEPTRCDISIDEKKELAIISTKTNDITQKKATEDTKIQLPSLYDDVFVKYGQKIKALR